MPAVLLCATGKECTCGDMLPDALSVIAKKESGGQHTHTTPLTIKEQAHTSP